MATLTVVGAGYNYGVDALAPAQFIISDGDDDSMLIGCSADSQKALFNCNHLITDINKVMILSLRQAQVGGLEQLAIEDYLARGKTRRNLYVPEAIVDELWDRRLYHPLQAIAKTRYKRATLDAYFNVISLSELSSLTYLGDLTLRPFRLPSLPGDHLYGLFIENPTGRSVYLVPQCAFDGNLDEFLEIADPSSLVVLNISDVPDGTGVALDSLENVVARYPGRFALTGAKSLEERKELLSLGFPMLNQGDVISL